ncbi:MAG: HD domain-containing protein [Candidatus Omnitrophica bacterium]|nr:HD domain-containing protein [Candidatus Omnitrophota bacterium]MCF7894554.1 HD domain-containing protein [Candidatus Omnitrophota bacterium]
MKENIEKFLKNFSSCFQLAQMYGGQHPEFNKALLETYQELTQILKDQEELTIAAVGGELTSGDSIFFDLSKKLTTLINKFKSKGFEKLTFRKNVTKDELKAIFLFFLAQKDKKADIEEQLKLQGIKSIKIGKIQEADSKEGKKEEDPKKSFSQLYTKSVANLSSSLGDLIEKELLDFTKFGSVVNNLMEGVDYHYQEILKLSKLKGKDTVTFAHLLNVSFLSIHFAKFLGLNNSESKKIGLASLFHDIGKIYISNRILKGGKLSDEEFEKIKSHSVLGAAILLNFVDKLGELVPVVAFEHHLKFGSGGYPRLNFPRRLHFASMLITLCDVYDALSQRRSYKNSFPPEQIYKIMKEGRDSQFDPLLFDNFFTFLGVWPNGTVILLSNGKVARVKSQNPDNIFSPEVEVVSDTPHKIIDLKQDGLNLKIKKSLNPYKEGKHYLSAD